MSFGGQHLTSAMREHEEVRYVLLDLARALAIGLLLLTHITDALGRTRYFGILWFYPIYPGGVAVTIFLLVSGIALEMQYGARKFRYFDFLLKRCLRIYPIYHMAVVIGLLVYICRTYEQTGTIQSLLSRFGLSDLILSITGFYAFTGNWGGPFIGASWFVGLILVMYTIYPILSRAIAKSPHMTIAILLVVSTLSRLLFGRYFPSLLPFRSLHWFPLCRVFEFSLGIYAVRVLQPKIWSVLNSAKRVSAAITFVSRISFPLFLIHHPLSFMIPHLIRCGVHQSLAILVFLLTSLLLSWLVLLADQHVPRRLILDGITHRWNAGTTRHAVQGDSVLSPQERF